MVDAVDLESTGIAVGVQISSSVPYLITNILIQSKDLKMNDICSRNRAFFHLKRFASREKLVKGDVILG